MRSNPRRCRPLVLIVLVATLLGFGAGPAAAQTGPSPHDLAAITVRPGDLSDRGWVHVGAFVHRLDDQARDHAAYLGRGTTAESVAEVLDTAGWERQYVSFLELPSQADPDRPEQRVRSYVTEYETAEGAAAGFAYLEDERAIISATDVPLDRAIGEQSELTSERGTGNADGRIFRSLDLTFRIGNLVAGVTLTQYATADRIDPDPELVQALAGLMADRVASPASGSSPGAQVVRIEDTAHEIVTFDDAYYRLGGEDIPLGGESADAAALRIETYAGAEHVYQLWQGVDAAEPAGALYGVTLLQFGDTAAAEAWTTELAEILATNPFYGDIRPEEAAEMIGDQTVVLSYTTGGGGAADPRALLIAVRAGSTVARVHLVPQGVLAEVSMDALTALARAQTECLQGVDCAATVAVPDELSDELATAAAPDSSPVVSPQASR